LESYLSFSRYGVYGFAGLVMFPLLPSTMVFAFDLLFLCVAAREVVRHSFYVAQKRTPDHAVLFPYLTIASYDSFLPSRTSSWCLAFDSSFSGPCFLAAAPFPIAASVLLSFGSCVPLPPGLFPLFSAFVFFSCGPFRIRAAIRSPCPSQAGFVYRRSFRFFL